MRFLVIILSLSIWRRKKIVKSFSNTIKFAIKNTNKNKYIIAVDVLFSNIYFGCTFEEYIGLKFYDRSWKNRDTYLTYYYNVVNYFKLNSYKDRFFFKDKSKFNTIFKAYIKRAWTPVNTAEKDLINFVLKHEYLILKPIFGDSGKDIDKICSSDITKNIKEFIAKYKDYILEEIIINHPLISSLNPTSLNTVRIVTIVDKENKVNFLFAGLRIGSQNSIVDNISKGGRIGVINISSGVLSNKFYGKGGICIINSSDTLIVDNFEIPYWNEALDMVRRAAVEVRNMRYNAWDVAITPNGPELVEGNHGGAGNQITQLHLNHNEEGLKPLMKYILKGKK